MSLSIPPLTELLYLKKEKYRTSFEGVDRRTPLVASLQINLPFLKKWFDYSGRIGLPGYLNSSSFIEDKGNEIALAGLSFFLWIGREGSLLE